MLSYFHVSIHETSQEKPFTKSERNQKQFQGNKNTRLDDNNYPDVTQASATLGRPAHEERRFRGICLWKCKEQRCHLGLVL